MVAPGGVGTTHMKLADDLQNVGGNQKCSDKQNGRRHNEMRPREVAEKCEYMHTGNQRSLHDQNQDVGRQPRGNSEVNERKTKKNRQDIDHGWWEKVKIRMLSIPIAAPKRRNCGTSTNRNRAISVSISANAKASARSVATNTSAPATGPKTPNGFTINAANLLER